VKAKYRNYAIATAAIICASAGAQTSVTIYGVADACIARSDNGVTKDLAINSGCSTGSRLGFRGTEDLGGGMTASFTLENGFNIDNGSMGQGGRLFGRKALVSIGSDRLGTVELGRDYAPAFYLIAPADPTSMGFGSASNMISTGANPTSVARNDNAINYLSPSAWGPVSVRVQYALGEQAAPQASHGRDTFGINTVYRDGPWRAGIAYARHRNVADTGADSATTVAVTRVIGPVTLSAIGQSGHFRGSRTAAAPSSATGAFSLDYRSWLLGATVRPGGPARVVVSIKHYDDRTRANLDATQWTLLGFYELSKRTELYAGYSSLRNAAGGGISIADATTTYTTARPGARPSVMLVGLRHAF
jgi:predicted porin